MNLRDILITTPFKDLNVKYKEKLDRIYPLFWLKTIAGFKRTDY